MIRAIIFDCDGTLYDSESISANATDYAFREILGRPITNDESSGLLGRPAKKVLNDWFPDDGGKIHEKAINYFKNRIPEIKPYPGVQEALLNLENRFRLAVVTSSHRDVAEKILLLTGIRKHFEFIVGQEDTLKHKPDPEPLVKSLKLFGLNSNQCVYVGDQPYDIVAAKA
ncbi:MAG: HAD family hydrolase, partial [Thermoplasmataceae archaeon]